MVCERCGAELIEVGTLTEKEKEDYVYVNEKFNCANMALDFKVLKDIEFNEGQVYEYFKASYEQLAEANYLRYMFEEGLRKRLGIENFENNIVIDFVNNIVYKHPQVEHTDENIKAWEEKKKKQENK